MTDKNNTPETDAPTPKQPYQKPKLIRLGSVTELTQGQTGPAVDLRGGSQ